MLKIEFIEGDEVANFVGQVSGAIGDLARQAREVGLSDVALSAQDAADALGVLLRTWTDHGRDTVPTREL